MKQEYQVVNLTTNTSTFFYRYNLKSARAHALEYMERNKGSFGMKLYALNESNFGDKWREIK